MIGWKLFRKRKDGSLGSLFINRPQKLYFGIRYTAKNHPTKEFAVRPGWHICREPVAPHLSMMGRVWCKVRFDGKIRSHIRPKAQSGLWYTSTYLTIIKENT
jgi:hypothetical protein